jgi:hypothetical protein
MWGTKVHTNKSDGIKAEGVEFDTGRQDAWLRAPAGSQHFIERDR